ncbi:E3 SUMO-protein ligase ZBED1-like [Styela clava]
MATEALKTKCQMMGIEDLKLIVDVATRWGSTFEMLNRLVKLHCPISLVLNDRNIISQPSTLSMRASDWEIIEAILPVVEPFDQVVQSLGGQDYATISTKVPSIRGLIKKLEVVETDASPSKQFKENRVMSSLSSSDADKLLLYLEKEMSEMGHCESLEQDSMEFPDVDQNQPSTSSLLSELISDAYDSAGSEGSVASDKIANELNHYMRCKATNIDPLTWWHNNKTCYPNLSQLALKYLSIPATPCERVFSTAGHTARELRSSLTGKHVEAPVFLKGKSHL